MIAILLLRMAILQMLLCCSAPIESTHSQRPVDEINDESILDGDEILLLVFLLRAHLSSLHYVIGFVVLSNEPHSGKYR